MTMTDSSSSRAAMSVAMPSRTLACLLLCALSLPLASSLSSRAISPEVLSTNAFIQQMQSPPRPSSNRPRQASATHTPHTPHTAIPTHAHAHTATHKHKHKQSFIPEQAHHEHKHQRQHSRRRTLEAPFPNGVCGGTLLEIPPEDTFAVDINLANSNWGGNLMLPPRPLSVWLPPDYNDNDDRHPVMYVHDGENAMVDTHSWTGQSWRLAGALTRMVEYGLYDTAQKLPICVLLPSPEDQDFIPGVVRRRHLEYGDASLPFAQAHVDFVAQTVKPYIDNRFRTHPGREHTFAMGSSLGGQASLHLLMRHPTLFGGAACMSPCFGPSTINQVLTHKHALQDAKIYLDIGGDMDDTKVPWLDVWDHLTPEHWWNPGYFWLDTPLQSGVDAMRANLDKAGIDHYFAKFPGGRHNERAWSQRIDQPLRFLYGNGEQ